jgi:hypothetical protein
LIGLNTLKIYREVEKVKEVKKVKGKKNFSLPLFDFFFLIDRVAVYFAVIFLLVSLITLWDISFETKLCRFMYYLEGTG